MATAKQTKNRPEPPTELEKAATDIKVLLGERDDRAKDWRAGTLKLARRLYEARTTFNSLGKGADMAFGEWLTANELGKHVIGHNERAALIKLGDPKYSKKAAAAIKSSHAQNARVIWGNVEKILDESEKPEEKKSKKPEAQKGSEEPDDEFADVEPWEPPSLDVDVSEVELEVDAMTDALEILCEVAEHADEDDDALALKVALEVHADPVKHQLWVNAAQFTDSVTAYLAAIELKAVREAKEKAEREAEASEPEAEQPSNVVPLHA